MAFYIKRLFCLLLPVLLLAGCAAPAGYTADCGELQLTFPAEFHDLSGESYAEDADFLYGLGSLIVKGIGEEKAKLPEMTQEDYAFLVIKGNQLDCTLTKIGESYRFAYSAAVDDTEYSYVSAVFEGATRFWVVQCYCPGEKFDEYSALIGSILENVRVSKKSS